MPLRIGFRSLQGTSVRIPTWSSMCTCKLSSLIDCWRKSSWCPSSPDTSSSRLTRVCTPPKAKVSFSSISAEKQSKICENIGKVKYYHRYCITISIWLMYTKRPICNILKFYERWTSLIKLNTTKHIHSLLFYGIHMLELNIVYCWLLTFKWKGFMPLYMVSTFHMECLYFSSVYFSVFEMG